MTGLQEGVALRNYTSFHIGGPARFFLDVGSEETLREGLAWCARQGLPWFVLGGGSNVLIDDAGFPGLVLRLSGAFRDFHIDEAAGELVAGGAVRLQMLGLHLAREGWPGFDYMCGIPGTVGGAVKINAGTKEGEVKDRFLGARILNPDGSEESVGPESMGFAYRHTSLLARPVVVLSARFRLGPRGDAAALQERVKELLEERRAREPKLTRNCGSVFRKTPDGKSAGWYIERAGCKGRRIGDATIAQEHANWILNLGNATAEDVRTLIREVQQVVEEKFGVRLVREVLFIPQDLAPAQPLLRGPRA